MLRWVTLLVLSGLIFAMEFDPETVRLVAHRSSTDFYRFNCVFRSNIPVTDNKLNYEDLTNTMREVAAKNKILIPSGDMYLVDINLLHPDDSLVTVERSFFQQNPQKGQVINVPVYGTQLDPSTFSTEEIINKSENLDWMEDDVAALVALIEEHLSDFSTPYNKYVLIHCKYGHDRTGETSGAYWVTSGEYSWEQVAATNWEVKGDAISYENQRALTWYCHHLQYHQGYTDLSCTHENLNDDNKKEPEMVGWDETEDSLMWAVIFLSVMSGLGILGCAAFALAFVAVFLVVIYAAKKRASSSSSPVQPGAELTLLSRDDPVDNSGSSDNV